MAGARTVSVSHARVRVGAARVRVGAARVRVGAARVRVGVACCVARGVVCQSAYFLSCIQACTPEHANLRNTLCGVHLCA